MADAIRARAAVAVSGALYRCAQRLRVLRRRVAQRFAGGQPEVRGRAAASRRRPQIADLQALNQHVIDSLPSGLATTDQSDRILTFNRAAQAITGVSFQSAVGRPIGEVMRLPRR